MIQIQNEYMYNFEVTFLLFIYFEILIIFIPCVPLILVFYLQCANSLGNRDLHECFATLVTSGSSCAELFKDGRVAEWISKHLTGS